MASCFCCQEEAQEGVYTYEFSDVTLTFCSQACKDETIAYVKSGRYINLATVVWGCVLISILCIIIFNGVTLPFLFSLLMSAIYFIMGLILCLHPVGYKSMIIKNGVHKTKKWVRISGIIVMILSVISIF